MAKKPRTDPFPYATDELTSQAAIDAANRGETLAGNKIRRKVQRSKATGSSFADVGTKSFTKKKTSKTYQPEGMLEQERFSKRPKY